MYCERVKTCLHPASSHGNLRISGQNLFLIIRLAVEKTISLRVIAQPRVRLTGRNHSVLLSIVIYFCTSLMSVLSYGSTGSNSQINALLSEGLKRRKVQTHKMQISPKLSWLRPRSIQTRQVLCYITLHYEELTLCG